MIPWGYLLFVSLSAYYVTESGKKENCRDHHKN